MSQTYLKIIVKAWDPRQANADRELITNTFDHYIKERGLDAFENRLDAACLEIAQKLGYVFERENNDLIFVQRGLQ